MIANSTFLWGCRGCFSHFRVTKSFHRDLPTHIHASLGILREENLAELDSTRPSECSSVTWPTSILCPMFTQESSPPKGWGIHDFTRRTARCSTSPRGPLAAPSLHSPSLGSCGVVFPPTPWLQRLPVQMLTADYLSELSQCGDGERETTLSGGAAWVHVLSDYRAAAKFSRARRARDDVIGRPLKKSGLKVSHQIVC